MARMFEQTTTMSQQPSSNSPTVTEKSEAAWAKWSGKESPPSSSRESSSVVSAGNRFQSRARAISRTETVYIASQLSVMVETGIALLEALDNLAKQAEKPHVKQALTAIHEKVRGGSDLSLAVASCPHKFPPILSCLLRASEASGAMGSMLSRAAEYLREEQDTIRRIRSTLIYPAVMFSLALVTTVLMVTYLLPRLAIIYKGHEDVLPLPTRIAFGLSNFVLANYIYIGVAVMLLAGGLVVYLRSSVGRTHTDWLKLHIPILGRMFRKFYLTRSVRTIGTMIGSGQTVPDAVHLARGISGNSYFNSLWKLSEDSLQAGSQLSDPLFASPLVPGIVAQMISTGEKTGKMPEVMEKISSFCEEDLRNTVRNVIALLEPLMIIVMGTVIAGMAMAVLLPIFSISKVLGG